jgi:thiol-disulfide isomerase/thioredoxin
VRGTGVRAVTALMATLLLAGCGDDGTSVREQMRQGDQKGYIAGDGTIERLDPQDRSTPILLEGTTLEDEAWASQDQLGQVVVVNVWGSWCGPCVEETPDLVQVAGDVAAQGLPVQFIGVNRRDSVPNAQAFEEVHGVPYPSLQDDGGRTLAQLQGLAVATPTTMVLDGQGRLAARVSGPVEASTLRGLVEDVLDSETAG